MGRTANGKAAERPAKAALFSQPPSPLSLQVPLRFFGPVLALHLMAVFMVKVMAGREECNMEEESTSDGVSVGGRFAEWEFPGGETFPVAF